MDAPDPGSSKSSPTVSQDQQNAARKKFPRLSHKKSRYGCNNCKRRRVKCDEGKPVCGSCQRHQVECQYERIPHKASSAVADSSVVTSAPSETKKRRLLEIRLVHHFTVSTAKTFPGSHDPHSQQVWVHAIPSIAVDYPPLLNALLAVSALHKFREHPEDHEMARTHVSYFNLALQEQRQAIAQFSEEEADSNCFTSILLGHYTFATLRERPVEPYAPPMEWLQVCNGITSIFRASLSRNPGQSTVVQTYLSNSNMSLKVALMTHEQWQTVFPQLLNFQPPGDDSVWDEELTQAYKGPTSFLGSLQHSIQEGDEPPGEATRRLMVFATVVPIKYLELVEAGDPRALVILAHFFAIAYGFRDTWWISDAPRRELLAMKKIIPADWSELMKWPLSVLEAADE